MKQQRRVRSFLAPGSEEPHSTAAPYLGWSPPSVNLFSSSLPCLSHGLGRAVIIHSLSTLVLEPPVRKQGEELTVAALRQCLLLPDVLTPQ